MSQAFDQNVEEPANFEANEIERVEKCEEPDKEEEEVDNVLDDESSPQNQKSFKDRALELMKKAQTEHSHLVERKLEISNWIVIHRIIRKSKGLK